MTFDQASAAHIDDLARVRAHCLRAIYRNLEPVAVPTSGDTVPLGRTTLSRSSEGFAAAGDATVSNIVSPGPVEKFSHTDRTGEVTHRDLSQHANGDSADSFEIFPVHGQEL